MEKGLTPRRWVDKKQQKGANTYIALAGVEDLLVTAEEDVSDAPRALESVCSGCKGKG